MLAAWHRTRDLIDPSDRLAELARSRGALRFVLSRLAATFADGKRWDPLGYVRIGDYARERLGLSGRSLYDLARVGRALGGLPRLEAALVSGALPWSKVRLLARFVGSEDELSWIARARALSVRQLEREVRTFDRGVLRLDADGNPEAVRLRVGSSVSFLWQRTQWWAARVSGERVSPGTVLEMVTAEALSALPAGALAEEPSGGLRLQRPVANVCTPHAVPEEGTEEALPESAPLPAFLAGLLAGLDDADAVELDARLRRAVRLEQRLDAEIAPLLRRGFSFEELGLSPRKARALLRLERASEICPELREAWRSGALSWVQAQVLAPLLLEDAAGSWRGAWVRFAQQVTVRRLEEVVGEALTLRELDPARWEVCRSAPGARPTCAHPTELITGIQLRVTASRDVARLFRAALCALRRTFRSEGEAFGAMLEHALASWGVGKQTLRRFRVFERDGWRCTVPGCTSYKNLHAHHIRFRSAGGGDELPLARYRSGDRVA